MENSEEGCGRALTRPPRRSRRTRSSGQAFVEFALVLPVLVSMVLGFAMGWQMLQTTIGLTEAARAGVVVTAQETGCFCPPGVDPLQGVNPDSVRAAIAAEQGLAPTAFAYVGSPACTTNPSSNPLISGCNLPFPSWFNASRPCTCFEYHATATGTSGSCRVVVLTVTRTITPLSGTFSQYVLTSQASAGYIPRDGTGTPRCDP